MRAPQHNCGCHWESPPPYSPAPAHAGNAEGGRQALQQGVPAEATAHCSGVSGARTHKGGALLRLAHQARGQSSADSSGDQGLAFWCRRRPVPHTHTPAGPWRSAQRMLAPGSCQRQQQAPALGRRWRQQRPVPPAGPCRPCAPGAPAAGRQARQGSRHAQRTHGARSRCARAHTARALHAGAGGRRSHSLSPTF